MDPYLDYIYEDETVTYLSPLYRQFHLFGVTKGYWIYPHAHSFTQLTLVLEGELQGTINGQRQIFRAGTIYVLPKNLTHEFRCDSRCLQLGIDINNYQDEMGIYHLLEEFILKEEVSQVQVMDLHRYLPGKELFRDHSELNRLEVLHLINTIVTDFLTTFAQRYQQPDFKKQFIQLMSEPKAYLFTTQEISQRLLISIPQLDRLVRRNFTSSIKQYKDRIRLNLICRLLEETTMSQKEIAQEADFFDVSHLHVFFKKMKGITPKQYRQMIN